MEHTIQNIKKVSLVFFIITVLLHIVSSLFRANTLYLKEAFIVNKTMDVPLVLTGLLYGFSSIRLMLTNPEKSHKMLDIFLLAVIILVLGGLLYVNLGVPNLN